MIDKYTAFIAKRSKLITLIFVLLSAISVFMLLGVKVNYNMADYLPAKAQSTKAVSIMETEFSQQVPNASVMIKNVSLPEALEYKKSLTELEGIGMVLWLDDNADITTPLEMLDKKTVESFYKNGNALFSISIEEGYEAQVIDALREQFGEKAAITGEAVDLDFMQRATSRETINAVIILLPVIILLLVLSTSSWVEPLLFLAAIGVSILINMGTNLFLGQVSFVTFAVSPILQLAVSLDYAIFLLHRFAERREKLGEHTKENTALAMREAVKISMRTVFSSALTTLFGFAALIFMGFQIGADLGINLAKGIILSFISCMLFLPALTLCGQKLIDKTRHRPFMPSFKNANRFFSKLKIPVLILVLLLTVPAFLGQRSTQFIYGSVDGNPNSQNSIDKAEIEENFGKSTIFALLLPRDDMAKEELLSEDLTKINHVTGVMSYANTVGAIPPSFLAEDISSQFYSENYARIIIYANTEYEGDAAFAVVEDINAAAEKYYNEFYSAGQSANLYDMASIVSVDVLRVNLIAIISIFFVLLITLRSGILPFILLFTIEAGIWINLAIPYFSGISINFIGYLVLSTVQLGATVDYAILLTSNYMHERQKLPQKQAMHNAMGASFKSILVSGGTLASAGFILYLTTSNPLISDIGLLLGRGTLLSMLMVTCLLPALLAIFDKAIAKTNFKQKNTLPQTNGDDGNEK